MNPPYAAVVLAGGTGRRLGGRDKPGLEIGGRRLLDRVLDAVVDAGQRIVVGPAMPLPPGVTIVREQPPGGGPVAALAAALEVVTSGRTMLLAADIPFLSAQVVAALLRAAENRDGAMLVDDGGRDQLLLGAWSTTALRGALAGVPVVEGAALRPLLSRLDAARVPWQVSAGTPPPWWDCDSVEDLRQARFWADLPLTEGRAVSELQDWANKVAGELGLPAQIGSSEVDLILDLARDAAHGVARPAAPLTTYLLGVAVGQGADPVEAAARITALAATDDNPS